MSVVPQPTASIRLAHEPAFLIGRLTILPATREIRRDDGAGEVIEPRVMQVLVALTHACGQVVSRSDLTQRCWEGRIVGEDAINRVMSRLRRLADGIGDGSFRVETITKVGYRLIPAESAAVAAAEDAAVQEAGAPPSPLRPTRRRILVGGVVVVGAATIGIGAERLLRGGASTSTPGSVQLMDQALHSLRQATREGSNQAVGLLRRAVTDEPDFADGWGALATTYAYTARYRSSAEAVMYRTRALAAAERAESIDPDNAYAAIGRAVAVPSRGNWLGAERGLQRAVTIHPSHEFLRYALAILHAEVGRNVESAAALQLIRRRGQPNPGLYFTEIMATWAANRLEETDRLIDEAFQLYPTHGAIWFARLHVQMYTGRAAGTAAMIDDIQGRPTGLPASEFEAIAIAARAIQSRAPHDVDGAMTLWFARARKGSGYAMSAVPIASALGRIDDAFVLLQALYFDRGFVVPEVSFTVQQGIYAPRDERSTAFLFWPSMAPVRRDPRFAVLTRDLGLNRYWRDGGKSPDYRLS